MRLLGLDGCKQNAWVIAESHDSFSKIRFRIEPDLQPLFAQALRGRNGEVPLSRFVAGHPNGQFAIPA
jgi:hypothetical protein